VNEKETLKMMAAMSLRLRRLAMATTTGCALWSLAYILFGGTASAKSWYAQVAAKHFSDPKGGVPIVTLVLPLLLAASVATLFNVRVQPQPAQSSPCRSLYKRIQHHGDLNFNRTSFWFLLLPLVIYLICNIHRHLHGQELGRDDAISEISNAFAVVALLAMSFFLIPVARINPLWALLNWDPASAIRLHIWSGRIIIVGVLMHGCMHMYRWKTISGESIVGLLVPPAFCWTLQESDYQPTCNDPDTECSCYFHFRNLTGFLALVGLLVISGTTFNSIRRQYYKVFYMTHVLAAPTVLLMAILHWRRSILYMAPSLLYYAATSIPMLTERLIKRRNRVGVKIVSVKYIASRDIKARPCVSLTLAASDEALMSFQPGQYVKLLAPEISNISHPFTINRVPGKLHELRIIFRATGSFTQQLATRLTSGSKLPMIQIDGFYGNDNRVEQMLNHDSCVLVAGGIGITPYLSVLQEVASIVAANRQEEQEDTTIDLRSTREVVLHWVCRDPNLVKYVKAQYFDSLRWNVPKSGFRIRIIVHDTNSHSNSTVSIVDSDQVTQESELATENDGACVTTSRFASGTCHNLFQNVLPFVTFTSIAWIGLWATWELYLNKTFNEEIVGRGWAAIAIVVIALAVSLVANIVARIMDKFQSQSFHHGLIENIEDNDLEMATVEEGIAKQPLVGGSENGKVDASSSLNPVTFEEKVGRPSVHELMKSLDGVQNPGLFICGPKQLTEALREASKERCQIRMRQCINGTPHIAVYEESFTL
jgi:predicted ferric reductase